MTNHVSKVSFEITEQLKVGIISKLNVQLSFAKGNVECTLVAKLEENGADPVIIMLLKCPMVCVECCQFSMNIKVESVLCCNYDFQQISCCSMIFKLNFKPTLATLTLNQLNNLISDVRSRSSTKIFFETTVTIRCDRLSSLQRFLWDIASPKRSDFTIKVADEHFPVHKCILSARSPVFARMLSGNNYTETQKSLLIKDFSKHTFMLFLRFMYGANMPDLSLVDAVDLIKIAEKYEVMDLKNICDNVLIEKLTEADPVHTIYQFAHQYNCSKKLIERAYGFVRKKYFVKKMLPKELSENPNVVGKLVAIMEEFEKTLKQVHDSVINSNKKVKINKY